jgi:hypothetical protein
MSLAPSPLALLQVADPSGFGGDGAARVFDTGATFPWVPVLLLVVPAVVGVGLILMYLRTVRRMRQAQLAPPVWLLPYLEHTEHGPPVWPPTESSEELTTELAERAESVGRLARRKRAILVGLALNFVPGAIPVPWPDAFIPSTLGLFEVQVTEPVMLMTWAFEYVPMAVNCRFCETKKVGLAGVTAMETRAATVTVVVPITLVAISVAVTTDVPPESAVPSPPAVRSSTAGVPESQVTAPVMLAVLLSL